MIRSRWTGALALALAGVFAVACNETGAPLATTSGGTPAPAPPVAAALVFGISVPEGFAVYRYADGFHEPAALAIDKDGAVWLAELDGDIYALPDTNRDRLAEPRRFASSLGLARLHGIALDDKGTLYASSRGRISVVEDRDHDGDADHVRDIVTNLPNGEHQNNNIVMGRDGRLYFGNGSTCNLCRERSALSAAVLTVKPDGEDLRVFAKGLRNAHGMTFGIDGNLYVTDNGVESPDDPTALNELNRIIDGADYGWPRCSGSRPLEADGCKDTKPPVAELQWPGTANSVVIYGARGGFPQRYMYGAFISHSGSNGAGTGRLTFVQVRDEKPAEDVFASGFDRPSAIIVDRTGALLVADAGVGLVYAIVYEGER